MSDDAQDRSADLLARWRNGGDREALDELLRTEVRFLKARLRRNRGNLGDPAASVSDVAQEAVMRMLQVEPPPVFDAPEAMRAYLWLAAWRLLIGRLRRPGLDAARLDESASSRMSRALETTGGFSGVVARDRAVALELALELLEPDERELLDLVYFQDAGIEGAAGKLGISAEAARKRVMRARKHLATKLASWTEMIG
jgi:RNA polymerase sigma factor (sigma-70 family)